MIVAAVAAVAAVAVPAAAFVLVVFLLSLLLTLLFLLLLLLLQLWLLTWKDGRPERRAVMVEELLRIDDDERDAAPLQPRRAAAAAVPAADNQNLLGEREQGHQVVDHNAHSVVFQLYRYVVERGQEQQELM